MFARLAVLACSFVNATTGWLVETMGWMAFFMLCVVLALPGMALLLKVAPWRANHSPPLSVNK